MSDALQDLIEEYLEELSHSNRSAQTVRAYRTDLSRLAAAHPGPLAEVGREALQALAAADAGLRPATRARRQSAVASFLRWAVRNDFLPGNPMDRVERVRRNPPRARALPREQVERILGRIPPDRRRDRLLFRLIFETGLRVGEALGAHVEDLDLAPDDERLVVLGKGNRRRTILLDDPRLVRMLRDFVKKEGLRHGPLFRARINGRGGPLRYQSVQALWARYCRAAGVTCTIHQLRHAHATELVRGGVSLATIRKRLGHRSLQSTLLYAEQSDAAADTEIRAWRRRRTSAE